MKYITSALVLIALFGTQSEQANAIRINAQFTDDLVKSLAQDMAADAEKETPTEQAEAKPSLAQQKTETKTEKKAEKKVEQKADKKVEKKAEKKTEKKVEKKADAKKDVKKTKKAEDDEIPMDAAAIKAYSSVIADAAEDSEPQTPVEYKAVITEEEKPKSQIFSSDPMGSMIQNEIASIKTASIKAAQEKDEE